MGGVFGEDKKDKLIEYVMKEDQNKRTPLLIAVGNDDEEIVKLLLNAFSEEKDKLTEYLMKEYQNKCTVLLIATTHGREEIVKLLLEVFSEKEKDKLIQYVMKENENKRTALMVAAHQRHEEIAKLLLKVFSEKEKDKLIQYVMKEDVYKYTSLHHATSNRHEKIVKLLLDVFGKEDNVKLVEYLMKKNQDNNTASCLASKSPPHVNDKIIKLLSQKLTNATNEIMISKIQQVTQKFKNQNTDKKDKSLLWYFLDDDSCCNPAKETIMKFLIIDYSIEMIKM